MDVEQNVIFGDYVTGEKLAKAYTEAISDCPNISCVKVRYELVEAMSYGVPVSYDITYGTKELVDDGMNGYVATSWCAWRYGGSLNSDFVRYWFVGSPF